MTDVEVAIVGAGFSGLAMAVRLLGAGETDIVVLERAGGVGGTWRDNTYPGAACDVPSHLYSLSFAPNPRWSASFSAQGEILDYLQHCAERFGVTPYVRFGHQVTSMRWDSDAQRWRVETSGGDFSARYVVSAQGPLTEPSLPQVEGLGDFGGEVWHTARWRHDVDLAGATVAVVGTGASAVQVVPELAKVAGHLDVYQRTPAWILPRRSKPIPRWQQRAFALAPPLQLALRAAIFWSREATYLSFGRWARGRNPAQRMALAHLRASVPDPALREALTPDYAIGCKRILLSDDFYPAVSSPHVELVARAVSRFSATGVVDAAGVERRADAVILATGFHATDPPSARIVFGEGGCRLADAWAGGMEAHRGTTVAGFPNLFLLVGPNTGLGHNSIVYMIESQVPYVAAAIAATRAAGAVELSVRPDAQAAWSSRVQRAMSSTVWTTGGCASWYLDRSGRNTTLWPGFSWQFRSALRRFDAASYSMVPPRVGASSPADQATVP